jgi:ATP-dependent 26S proteasome regulatory subunit
MVHPERGGIRVDNSQKASAVDMKERDPLLAVALQRVDLLVRIAALEQRLLGMDPHDPYRGLLLSDEEVDDLLQVLPQRGHPEPSPPALCGLKKQLDELEGRLERLGNPLASRLGRLLTQLALTPLDRDILLLTLLPEIDPRYGRLFAFLQDNVTRCRPSVFLALRLLCRSEEDRCRGRTRFLPTAPLGRHLLIHLLDHPHDSAPSLLQQALQADERVVNYLLGSDESDTRLSSFAHIICPQVGMEELILDAEAKKRLLQLARRGVIFFFQGSYGVGKKKAAEALCKEMRRGLLVVDLAWMLEGDLSFETALRLSYREGLLQDAVLYWDHFDVLLDEDKSSLRQIMARELETHPGLTFLAGERAWEPVGALHEMPIIQVEFPIPSYEARKHLWEAHLDGRFPTAGDVDIGALANKFRFSAGQIRDAIATARNLALGRGEERIAMADLYQACRVHSNQRLSHLACKVRPHYTWADIVLPPDQMRQLREIVNYVKYRPLVYGDWGFDRKLSLGKGLNALFAGPPGTGKTMAADIIAGELGLDLYKIDLSMVVSKYIGETEKNLNKVFKEAEMSNSILFFDEADALFGKRSEVRDSHDRYANIEIAYLMQKMEEYEGIVILATNLRQNLDEAFVRRMHFTVEFPFPEEEHRRRIWEVTFPSEAPWADDIDNDFLARQFKLAGGNIRNIILSAAFLAAEDGRVIGMEHLIRATRREFQKMGKLVMDGDFGPYDELVRV